MPLPQALAVSALLFFAVSRWASARLKASGFAGYILLELLTLFIAAALVLVLAFWKAVS